MDKLHSQLSSSKRKVLFLAPGSDQALGGVANFKHQFLKHFQSDTFEVVPFRVGRSYGASGGIFRMMDFSRNLLRYLCIMLFDKPDIVHLNPSLNWRSLIRDGIYAFIANICGCSILLFFQGWHESIYKHFYTKKGLAQSCVRMFLSFADIIGVQARAFKKQLEQIGIERQKIFVSWLMVDCSEFQSYPRKSLEEGESTITKELLLFEADFVVLFLARLEKDKGLYELIRAIPKIIEKSKKKLVFAFAGDGSQRDGAITLCKELNIEERVYFPGYVRGWDKISLFINADLFVFPTYHGEGSPTVILEAIAAGLPVISTPVGAIPEIIEHRVNGLIIPVPSEKEIESAVLELIDNRHLADRMGKNNIKKAKENFDISVVVENIERRYEGLMIKR